MEINMDEIKHKLSTLEKMQVKIPVMLMSNLLHQIQLQKVLRLNS